jgi:predicted DNA binding protein
VESLSHISRGDTQLFRVTLSGDTVATTLFDCGAVPREVVATAEETTAVVQLPQELDVRVFLGRLETHYPAVELLTRADVESEPSSHEQAWTVLEEELTERQREVLLTAYESGYFQSPRETTGAELAALFDISQPTLTYHLREAQRRLFDTLFTDHR